jgi:drug/metabolite transporter (DMT)-like permease
MNVGDMLFIFAIALPLAGAIGLACYLLFKDYEAEGKTFDVNNSWIITSLFMFGFFTVFISLFWNHKFE